MCVLKISDELMAKAGLKDEREAVIEFACRLFDAGKLAFEDAMEMTALDEQQLARELKARDIRCVLYTQEMWEEDQRTIKKLGL